MTITTARRLVIAAALLLVVAWPVGGSARSGRSAASEAEPSPAPSRHDAVAAAAPHSPAVATATDRVTQAEAAVTELTQQLGAMHTTAYQEHTAILPVAVNDTLAWTRAQRYADVAARALADRLAAAQRDVETARQQQAQALAAYFAAITAAAQEAERVAAEQAAPVASAELASTPPSTGTCSGDLACFLACTRAHESDTAGGYGAVSPDGVYRGAYQFDQSTWDSVAASIGRGDLVGVNPASASPTDQDTLAAALYAMRGNQPWGGRC